MLANPHSPVVAQLVRLEALGRDELAAEWVSAFGVAAPRKSSREFLLKAMAHHVQVKATRDVRPAVRKVLLRLGRSLRDGTPGIELPPAVDSLKPGSRLIRAWRGETHEVTVLPDGRFEWRDRRFGSLSAIATTITGTRRNGPAFFGLRETGEVSDHPAPSASPVRTPSGEVRP